MIQFAGISASLPRFQQFRQSLLDGFRTFLPYQARLNSGDVFIRSGS